MKLDEVDRRWVDALKPYVGGGFVPIYRNDDGSVDTVYTIDRFCEMHGIEKIDGK